MSILTDKTPIDEIKEYLINNGFDVSDNYARRIIDLEVYFREEVGIASFSINNQGYGNKRHLSRVLHALDIYNSNILLIDDIKIAYEEFLKQRDGPPLFSQRKIMGEFFSFLGVDGDFSLAASPPDTPFDDKKWNTYPKQEPVIEKQTIKTLESLGFWWGNSPVSTEKQLTNVIDDTYMRLSEVKEDGSMSFLFESVGEFPSAWWQTLTMGEVREMVREIDGDAIGGIEIEDTEEVRGFLEGMGFSASLIDYQYWHFYKTFGDKLHILHIFMSSPIVIRVENIVISVKTVGELKTWIHLTFGEVTSD